MYFVCKINKNDIYIKDTTDNSIAITTEDSLNYLFKLFQNLEINGILCDYIDRNIIKIQAHNDIMHAVAWNYKAFILDKVLEEYEMPDCIEIIGTMGGDPLRYRIMKNGQVYEK